jgi:hypothetical protein
MSSAIKNFIQHLKVMPKGGLQPENKQISILPGQCLSWDRHLPLANLQDIATTFRNTFCKTSEEPS